MSLFSNASIQRKLVMVISCTSLFGLNIACLAFEYYERTSFRASMVSTLMADAHTLGWVPQAHWPSRIDHPPKSY
jgi:hypothetical protein